MTLSPLLSMLLGISAPPSIELRGDQFLIRSTGAPIETSPLTSPKMVPATKVEFRSDQTFVLWDRRGLTIRKGDETTTTRLSEIPTSPRLRDHDAVVKTVNAVRDRDLSLDAAALSGARRIGKTVYLVVRWEQARSGWLEALVSVDLAAHTPTAHALAVLPGLTFSSGAVSDSLVSGTRAVCVLIHRGPTWGLWTYDAETAQGEFRELGEGIKYAAPVSADMAAFVEKTAYGGYAAGTVDMQSGVRSDALEAPALWIMLDTKRPPVAEAGMDDRAKELANLETGAVLEVPADATERRARAGVLVWIGGRKPTKAWLYDPIDWRPLAWWRKAD